MNEDAEAVGEMMMLNQAMLRSFLRVLLLEMNKQGFDLAPFAEALYWWQDNLPSPADADTDEYEFQARHGLKEWTAYIKMVEDLIATRSG